MSRTHRFTSLVLSTLMVGGLLVGTSSTAVAQSSGPACSAAQPDTCQVETFDGASQGRKGTSWMSPEAWDVDVFNYNGTTPLRVVASHGI